MKTLKLAAIFCVIAGSILLATRWGALLFPSEARIEKIVKSVVAEQRTEEKRAAEEQRLAEIERKKAAERRAEEAKKAAEEAAKAEEARRAEELLQAEQQEQKAKQQYIEAQKKADRLRKEQGMKSRARAEILSLVNKKDLQGCRAHSGWKRDLSEDERYAVEAVLADYSEASRKYSRNDYNGIIQLKQKIKEYLATVGEIRSYEHLLEIRGAIIAIENNYKKQ